MSELLAVMQEMAPGLECQAVQQDRIAVAIEIVGAVDRACRCMVQPGTPGDAPEKRWIACAVRAWSDAGLTPSASERSRFVKALRSFAGHPSIPTATLRTLGRALRVWRVECGTRK
jgi:hypothetical protein